MTDITKCLSKTCPSRKKCFRFTAPYNGWQSYSKFEPKKGQKKCDNFYDNKEMRTK